MPSKKGEATLSESMINIVSLIISFVLIIIVVKGIFTQSSETTYQSAFEPIARDITSSIDRIAALAGSQQMYFEVPAGMNINITIDNKLVTVYYDKGTVEKSFSGLIHSGPYFFENPGEFCLVKNRDDRRITITAAKCVCKKGDGVCDPACLLEYTCDPDCKTEAKDNFCSSLCSKSGDGICDPDCYSGENDRVCDSDCITSGIQDGICDPDCASIKKGICDMDCFTKYNGTEGAGGVCDPDCKPIDSNNDKYEDKPDGICYTGCALKVMDAAVKIPKDGICDLDCNETNNICDPDCNLDEDCADRCAAVGESCAGIPCCQDNGAEACCPGTMKCANASSSDKPACCGNGKCEVSPIAVKLYSTFDWKAEAGGNLLDYSNSRKEAKDVSWNETSLPRDWENLYSCLEDCSNATGDLVCNNGAREDGDCILYCKSLQGSYGCCNTNYSSSFSVCPNPGGNTKDQSISDGICMGMNDGVCDPDCAFNNEICDPDCCEFNSQTTCPSSPACYCPVRVSMSQNFRKAPSYYDTFSGVRTDDSVGWTSDVIEVCSQSAISYLDRRGWDIKQVERDIISKEQRGFKFDASRYVTIRNSEGKCGPSQEGVFIQKASKTINANEAYNLTDERCCSSYCGRDCGDLRYVGPVCDGVGFCADHAVAILTILRTLGVPQNDVYAALSSSASPQFRHAYAIYFCDTSLPENLKLAACIGNENKWLRVDATFREIGPLENSQWCDHFCIVYNDYGAYPQIDNSKNGFGGYQDQGKGYAFPKNGNGGAGRDISCSTDSSCILNRASPQGLCQELGLGSCLT